MSGWDRDKGQSRRTKGTQTLEVMKISRSANADLDNAFSGLHFALAHMPSRLRDMVRMVSRFWKSTGDLGRDAGSNERFVDVLERDVRRRKSMLEIRSRRLG